ncbi:flagellar motor switch phosphatase FliY [Pelotomaculum propionicicum]|uniref:Flagellar motor switch protein FliN n=1 Tax=Pelotomaculum propionicicum TaxID=258475 RepID=A0A4Y7RQL6_9FIRM|nr:flagellar motor switch phosphatase FliY [Pelotomaculum propionicicum]NLI11606.1 flagellar motor switch phosphatase FliY [Peptococcaceae bacterium]TEB11131.1 Flagellar motor switch protein FliN [Pelotomaculum propionicicum]
MSNRLLKQEEIDALLNAQDAEPSQPESADADFVEIPLQEVLAQEGISGEPEPASAAVETSAIESGAKEPEAGLTDEQKDALGEVGNICMGSASTTLSMLLNQKVNITSPRVTITSLKELFDSFAIPHITIFVRFIEGLSGFNLLIMKIQDAAVLADLMMGGDGSNITEELNEIGVSAASEAMNQMIGSASTSMATMFNRTVNISPPETRVCHNSEDLDYLNITTEGPIVTVWFDMSIGDILYTQIMQVMGLDTAREEAGLILGQLFGEEAVTPPAEEESQPVDLADSSASGEIVQPAGFEEFLMEVPAEAAPFAAAEPELPQEPPAVKPVKAVPRPSSPARPVTAPPGFDQQRLDMILDIPLKVTVLLGRTRWPIKDILGLSPGSVVEMQSLVDEPVEVLVNGTLVATGEVVVVNENFGVRITNIIGPEERIKNLNR